MADKIKSQEIHMNSESQAGSIEETQTVENIDDFDPFSGVVECINEYIDVELDAPPEKDWYHGRLSRQIAEERLEKAARNGGYLVRESDRKPGSYVLSFFGRTGTNHFRITAMCGDYYIGGRQFDKLSMLIGYYSSCSDLLKDERLQHPVAPPEPVYDMRKVVAIISYTPMPDTDELGFEKGEMFIVHNDLGDGWLWVTSQSDEQSGIVNKELVQELNGNVDPVITNEWYWDNISKQRARDILSSAGPGSWLVRPSDSTKGDHVLFFYHDKQIERFKIKKEGRFYVMGGRHFDSVGEIMERYKKEQIVEGRKLGEPVLRKKPSDGSLPTNKNIPNSLRQSSGSNFFLNRKDQIVMSGFLNKKSKSSKKWKKMYFLLNETELQLYYFDNLKRSKPKGLIDLSYSYLYPVSDSFFDRPNCFQIVTRGLNHVQVTEVVYICADSADIAQEWLQHLKVYCQNTQHREPLSKHVLPRPTELRSVHLKIFDARKLPVKHIPHPYCIVSLNDVKVCRTPVKETCDSCACWDEQFTIDDIPPDIDSITVSIYNSIYNKVRRKDVEVLSMRVPFSDLVAGESSDKWHNLMPVNATTKGEPASLRVNVKFRHEVIMPLPEYNSLKELLLDKELKAVMALASTCTSARVTLATSLLQIFRHQRQEAYLLRCINDHEIQQEEYPSQLFRGTSMSTAIMDQYMKMTATAFVHQALQSPIQKVMESRQSCEISPCHLENAGDVETNSRHLQHILSETVDSIFQSAHTCPMVLKYICGCLQRKTKERWPSDPSVQTRVVSGFIFLRLLCPAILNPRQFNLITESPSVTAVRTLKLVANCLIKLANLTEYHDSQFENIVNPFLRNNQSRLIQFLNNLSNVGELDELPQPPNIDLARALATIHHICSTHREKLQQAPFDNMKTLAAVTEVLTNHKKTYMKQ